MYGLSAFLERCLDEPGIGRRKLVVPDWGALALIGAQRRPELPEKLAGPSLALDCADLAPPSCPAFVVWGERDPYVSTDFAQAFAEALPDAEMELVPGAGHWPWVDDARVVDQILDFLR